MTTRSDGEKGAALPTIAIMLVVLLGTAALAVDLGWLYLNSNRVQKTADAAALAGVVNLPTDIVQAEADAAGAVTANGFPAAGMTATPIPDNRLQVDLTVPVDTFFMSVFGFDTVDVERRSTAQYILPVPLGSPSNCMGRDPTGLYCTSGDPGFWVAISGSETAKVHGDAYTARCLGNEGQVGTTQPWVCEGSNSEQRGSGYNYAVEVAPGTGSVTVRLYDAGFYDRFAEGLPFDPTIPFEYALSAGGGVNTTYQLLAADNTPYDPSDNPPLAGCGLSIASGASPGTYRDRWATLCTLTNPPPGIYVLNVDITGATGGSNAFSIAANSTGPPARVYGLTDMGLFNNNNGSTATINLAEIDQIHAGKTMVVGLFDSGDARSNVQLQVLQPNGSVATCSWSARADTGAPGPSGSGPCTITTTVPGTGPTGWNRLYNGQWLDITIDIPGSYTCSSDCFWQVRYSFSGGTEATDRTTWTATVIGNPVRLVPNAP
jgi:hypothetical protein